MTCVVIIVYDVHMVSSFVFFLMIRRPPIATLDRSSAASDVYKRQVLDGVEQRPTVSRRHLSDVKRRLVAG